MIKRFCDWCEKEIKKKDAYLEVYMKESIDWELCVKCHQDYLGPMIKIYLEWCKKKESGQCT